MQNMNKDQRLVNRLLWLLVVASLFRAAFAAAGAEQRLDVLKTRTGTYRDVTVTKKTKEWIFILHGKGMVNIRISDLSPETRRRLGYDPTAVIDDPKAQTNEAAFSDAGSTEATASAEAPAH